MRASYLTLALAVTAFSGGTYFAVAWALCKLVEPTGFDAPAYALAGVLTAWVGVVTLVSARSASRYD